MGCSSCGSGGSGGCSTGGGCGTSGGCSKSGGCATKLNSFDWLSDMSIGLAEAFDVVEIRFKNGRKEFYRNTSKLELYTGDPVVVEMTSGYHLGHVALQGEIVRLQMKRKLVKNNDELKAIVRKAGTKDLEKYELSRNRETGTMFRARNIILEQKLEMKLTDVEYQADNTKATFYYSADERVDFRELIKFLASEFKIRVEMKQISLRHEAARLGGIGSCGRELCCSTWIADFKNVNTSAARYQNLSLNPSKLSGQCGRLKCCLNYELDTYLDALKGIPEVERPLLTEKGSASLLKTDIFKKTMWFAYADEPATWISLPVARVYEILALNKENKKPVTLEHDEEVIVSNTLLIKEKSELSRFDDKFQSGANKKKKKKKKPSSGSTENRPVVAAQGSQPTNVNRPNRPVEQNKPRPQANRHRQNIVEKPQGEVKPAAPAPKPAPAKTEPKAVVDNTENPSGEKTNNKSRNNRHKRKPNRPPHRPSENNNPPSDKNEN
jgi:cell fate regulator YaaT (PSP1 superfamily)